jgi:DNA replication protein DnaC
MLWHGIESRFISATDLLMKLRASFKDDAEIDEMEIITELSNISFLVIDDIGAEKSSEYSLQSWYSIIDHRYGAMLPTVYTSNFPANKLADKIGDRLVSRISSGLGIKISGVDWRLRK